MKRVKEASLEKVTWLCDYCMGQMSLDMTVRQFDDNDPKFEGEEKYLHTCQNGHTVELDMVYPHYTIDGELIDAVVNRHKVLTAKGEAIEIADD